jgi:molybdate transport system substrate-binding protein
MSRKLVFITILSFILLTACTMASQFANPTTTSEPTPALSASSQPDSNMTPTPQLQGSVTIFAAASLADAFKKLGEDFQLKNPQVEIIYNFAGSQQLSQQLAQGAPADIFASADMTQMQAAIDTGRVQTQMISAMAGNRLVVITPASNPGTVTNLQGLAKDGLKLVLAAPEVPAGAYTLQFLDKASDNPEFGEGFKDQVLSNVVSYEENVRAVLSKVILGEADAGIVYLSDALKAGPTQVLFMLIPQEINVNATYWIAPVADTSQEEIVRQFIDYVLSEEGQTTLTIFGFIPTQ